MRIDDLAGAIWLPGDGRANPTDLTAALARGARDRGVTIRERTRVTGILTDGRAVTGVRTDHGDVEAEVVVNCAGQWAKAGRRDGRGDRAAALGRALLRGHRAGRRGAPGLPDPARPGRLHLHQGGGRRAGGRRLRARRQAVGRPRRAALPVRVPAARRGLGPLRDPHGQRDRAGSRCSPRPGSRCSTTARRASPRTTSSSSARRRSCGTSSSAPASTRSASRPRAAPGGRWPSGSSRASRAWTCPRSTSAASPPFNGNNQWLHDRVSEVLGLHYAVPWPNRELASARPFRRSPAYHLLKQANAGFGSKMGWERANFFAPPGQRRRHRVRLGPAELAALVLGRAARRPHRRRPVRPDLVLQVPGDRPGRRAGAAVAVHRRRRGRPGPDRLHRDAQRATAPTRPTSPSPGSRPMSSCWSAARRRTERDKDHITRRMPARPHASLVDVTSAYAVYGVMGPRSRELLGQAVPQRPQRRGLPVRHEPRDRPRLRHGPRDPDHLRRRARLGAVRPGGVRRRRLRGPDGRGRRPRPGQRRLLRDRVAAPGEGLPGLRPRADPGLQPGRGRAAVRLQAQDRHPVPGPGGGRAGPAGRPGAGWSRSCSPTPTP